MPTKRNAYRHVVCGTVTIIPDSVVDMTERDPAYAAERYPQAANSKNGINCDWCHQRFPRVDENGEPKFFWEPDGAAVVFPADEVKAKDGAPETSN